MSGARIEAPAPAPALTAAMQAAIRANEQVTRHTTATVEATLDLGRHLADVKGELSHGDFRPWLAAHGISKDRAARAMLLHRAGVEKSHVRHFGSLTAAVKVARVLDSKGPDGPNLGRGLDALEAWQGAIRILDERVAALEAEQKPLLAENRKLRREVKATKREIERWEAKIEGAANAP